MRVLLISALTVISAVAESPGVQLINATRPANKDFEIGDRFLIEITGAANQPVSVRTTVKQGTDWGPVIGWTDLSGRWSTAGQFEKSDFGDWSEVWTVGGKLANPVIHFSVVAPCLRGADSFMMSTGANMFVMCETAQGRQTFGTASDPEPFRTPDGRMVPGRMRRNMTAEQYHMEIIQYLITSRSNESRSGRFGDEAATLILKMIGPNALSEDETRNVLSIIRAAFEKPDRIPQAAKDSSGTLVLLRNLADSTEQENLKQQIAETMTYVQAR